MDSPAPPAFRDKALAALQAAESARDRGDWTLSSTENRVKLYTAPTDLGLDAVKLEMDTAVPPDAVWQYIWANWKSENDRLQPDLVESHEVLQTYTDSEVLWRQYLRSPVWGVDPRELLLFDWRCGTSYGLYIHLSTSVDSGEVSVARERVRAELVYGVHFIRQTESSGSRITSVSLGDAKGSIPRFLVNWKVSARSEFYARFLTEMEHSVLSAQSSRGSK